MFNKPVSRRSFLTISAMTAATLALDWGRISAYAAKMGPKSDYPTVVIGAGLGGLVCGAYLAKQGIPVTVVEQHSIPGGYATSFERAGGKYTFEVSLHGTSINTNAPARILNEIGVLDKIDLVQLPEIYRYKTPKLDISVPQKDPEEYIKRLTAHFPEEADGIRGFVEEMIAISEEENRLHLKDGRFFKLFFPFQYRKMWNVRNKTLADLMNAYVKNSELQEILAALWGYYGLPPSRLSGFYYANATGGYLRNGSFYIRQRSQDLSDAIAEVIEENGGKILYDTAVDRILVEKGVVKGVGLSGGETLPGRAVVSNASAPTTFQEMVPEGAVPEDYLKKLRGYKPSISSFIVWLGLNRDISDQTGAFSTHVSSGLRPDQDYQAKLNGEVENGSFGVAIYGFEQSMDNAYMNRIENYTPIKGLYLAGSWGNPGGGYSGAFRSGEKTFQALMEEWGG